MKSWIIPCVVLTSAAAVSAVLLPSGGEITMRPGGKPIVAQRQGDKMRMCWPEAETKFLTDSELVEGKKPADAKVKLICTDWQ